MESHNLMEYSNYLPAYTIGDKAYEKVYDICKVYGKTAVVVGVVRAMAAFKPVYEAQAKDGIKILEYIPFGGACYCPHADELYATKPSIKEADMVFAVGGGKAMDFGKYLAMIAKKPLFTFPTIAATCAPITKIGIYYNEHNVHIKNIIQERPPLHCFINTKIIAEAPETYLWAGIGDTLAKNYESHFSSRGDELDHSNWLGLTIAPISSEGLVQHGTQAMADCKANKSSYELEQAILAIIVSTGLVSINVIHDYNASLAHSIFYALTALPQIEERHLHGEVVSYGVLVLLTVDNQIEERNKLFALMRSIKLPTCLKDIEVSWDEMVKIAPVAVTKPDMAKAAYPISVDMVLKAVKDLEEYNKEFDKNNK